MSYVRHNGRHLNNHFHEKLQAGGFLRDAVPLDQASTARTWLRLTRHELRQLLLLDDGLRQISF